MRNAITLGRGEQVTQATITNYPFGFPIEAEVDVLLYLGTTRLALGFDYSITGITDIGFVAALANDPGDGRTLIALLNPPFAQTLELIRGGGIPSRILEDKLDLVIEICQQFEERYRRTIRLPEYSLDEDITAPDYVPDRWWAYHPTERRIILKDPPIGSAGAQGPAGPGILFGDGVPSGSLGTVNATYIDRLTFNIYSKTDVTTWTLAGNIKGAMGEPGTAGVSDTVGAAGGRASVVNGDFAAGALSAAVNLSSLNLADTNFQFIPSFSWPNSATVTILSAASVQVDFSAIAPADGVMMWVLVARGDITTTGSTVAAHDHTAASGDGGLLTRDWHDSYSAYNFIFGPGLTLNPPVGTVWIYPDAATGIFTMKTSSGRVTPIGYYLHSHSGSFGAFGDPVFDDGGPLENPLITQYLDITAVVGPPAPGAGIHRVYKDVADGHLKTRNNAGTVVDLEAGATGAAVGVFGARNLRGTNDATTPNTKFVLTADRWVVRNSTDQVGGFARAGTTRSFYPMDTMRSGSTGYSRKICDES